MPLTPDLLAVSARQESLLTRQDLRRAGITQRQLGRLRANGALEPLGHQTFRVPGAPSSARQRLVAACLETGGTLSHRTAARAHGLDVRAPRLPEVTLLHDRGDYRVPLAIVHTTTWLPEDDLVVVDGLPCTSVARTLFSLAALVPRVPGDVVRDAVDAAVRDGKASDAWLWWRLEKLRCRGRNGVSVFEEVLARRAEGEVTESWLERQFLAVVRDAGLPVPRCQQRIRRNGSFVGRVDFLYESERLVVEVSGHRYHSSPAQLARDIERRNELVLAGYRFLEFTYDHIVRDPAYVVAQVRASLLHP